MEKRRISRILARADGATVKRLADEIKAVQSPVIVKAPEKSLAMIRMREPVRRACSTWGKSSSAKRSWTLRAKRASRS